MTERVSSPVKPIYDCWNDEKRINALFLPFRKKELNPVDWESKMKFWHSAIENWALEKNNCIISIKKLKQEFKRKDRSPLCLETVIENLYSNGDIKQRDEFIGMVNSNERSWSSWAVLSLAAPVRWSLTKLRGAFLPPDNFEVEYVYLHYLKVRSEEILSTVKNHKKNLIRLDELELLVTGIDHLSNLSLENLIMVINWLVLMRRATMIIFEGKTLVKFCLDDSKPAESVTEAEIALFTLKQNRTALIRNLEALESQKQCTIDEARAYLGKGMRHAAKSSLRKKKTIENCIMKRSNALDNIENLLSRIHDAESDVQLIQAYKVGLSALKTTFKNAGLTEDSVIDTMDQVHETIGIQDEIQSALSESVTPNVDEELEKELGSILELATPENEPCTDVPLPLPDLPEVPEDELKELTTQIKKLDLLLSE